MSLAKNFTLQETVAQSNLILEARIGFKYRDFIPGTFPRRMGIHWLFQPNDIKIIQCPAAQALGNPQNDLRILVQLGFWTVDGNPDQILTCAVGDRVLAHLAFVANSDGYIVLTPVGGSSHGVIDPQTGRSQFRPATVSCQNFGLPGGYPPMTIAYGILSDLNPWGGDLTWAAYQWNQNTGSNIQVFGAITNPTYTHYSAAFGSLPSNTNAETVTEINERRPDVFDQYPITFNSSRSWSAPGNSASGTQYDFRSIALHEIGHAMGLEHLPGANNVMYAYHVQGEIRDVLQTDDIDCMKKLLP